MAADADQAVFLLLEQWDRWNARDAWLYDNEDDPRQATRHAQAVISEHRFALLRAALAAWAGADEAELTELIAGEMA